FWKRDPEPATAMTEHGIKFVQFVHAPRDLLDGYAELVCQFALLRMIAWQEFVERRIEKPDRTGQTFERRKDADEIAALVGKQFRQRSCALVLCAGENHLAHGVDPIAFEKHVFGPAEPNPFRAECDGV